jgi:protein phosphatase 2C
MEEMSPAVAVPFRVGNSLCDNQTIATHIDITTLKLMADKGGLLSDSVTKPTTETVAAGDEDLANEVQILAAAVLKENKGGRVPMLDMVSQNESNWVDGDDVIVAPEWRVIRFLIALVLFQWRVSAVVCVERKSCCVLRLLLM